MDCFPGIRRDGEAGFKLPVCRQTAQDSKNRLERGSMSALGCSQELTPTRRIAGQRWDSMKN
jgi:hypothetical protein